MRDMLNVTIGNFSRLNFFVAFLCHLSIDLETKGVSGSDIDMKFAALKNNITPIETSAPTYKAVL